MTGYIPTERENSENNLNWQSIESCGYDLDFVYVDRLFTYQENVSRNKVEAIKNLYRSHHILLAPPVVKYDDNENKYVIVDGNHRALAMYELMTQEGYICTCMGLYHGSELGSDEGSYLSDQMYLAIIENPQTKHGKFLQHISGLKDRVS